MTSYSGTLDGTTPLGTVNAVSEQAARVALAKAFWCGRGTGCASLGQAAADQQTTVEQMLTRIAVVAA